VHLLHDRVALIQVKEENSQAGIPSGALFVSTLESATPFILLNVSLGDQAVMIERDCGCGLQGLGWTRHLHSIRSYEKLIAGGMSFLDTDLALVMEETLPECFGGSPTHYQLLGDSDERGVPFFRILVHPEVGPVDPRAVVETFLTALSSGNGVERMMGMVCKDAELLAVERTPPLTTSSGKILHFHQGRQAP
jgi:hypothetical protein